jgi:sec-independent protein translocase protein TatA
MFGLGFQEVLLLLVIALLLFGSKRLPEVGKALGTSIREFKKAMQGDDSSSEKKDDGEKK